MNAGGFSPPKQDQGASLASKPAEYSLFVRYLPDEAKLEELVAAFAPFGKILPSTRLFSMKRIGFVDFETEEALKAAERATIKVRNTIVACERAVAKGGPLPAIAIDKRKQIDKARGRLPRRASDLGSPRVGTYAHDEEMDDFKRSPVSQDSAGNPIRHPRPSMEGRQSFSIRSDYSYDEDERHDFYADDDVKSDEYAANVFSIYVGGIPDVLTKDDLDLWLIATLPTSCVGKFRFVRSNKPGMERIGFIDFTTQNKAREALEILRGSKVKGYRLRLEMARTPPAKAKPKPAFPVQQQMFLARIPHVPPGTSIDTIMRAYSEFGQITDIVMKNLDLNSGELIGEPLQVAPAEPKYLLASITFDKVEDAVRAAAYSGAPEVDMLQVVRNGDSLEVVVGPFLPTTTLAHVARTLSKFGTLSGARLVKKTTACLIAFENEASAKAACERSVELNGVRVTAIGHHVYFNAT